MKTTKALTTLIGLLFASGSVSASIVTFNNTAPTPPGGNFYGIDGSYEEAGLTISALGGTYLYTVDPDFFYTDHRYFSANGSDYAILQQQIPQRGILRAATPFSLQSFQAANLYLGGTLHIIGTDQSGGTISKDIYLPAGHYDSSPSIWQTISFDLNWANLVSVELNNSGSTSGSIVALDNIVFNEPASPVPIPGSVWLFGSALAGFGFIRNSRAKSQINIPRNIPA